MSDRRDESFGALFEQAGGARSQRQRHQVGDKVDVTVVVVAQNAVFVDLGGKQEGYFERVELTDPEGKLLVQVGSRLAATVAHIDRNTGQIRLKPLFLRSNEDDATPLATETRKNAAPVLVEGARVKGTVTGIERFGVFVQITGTSGRQGRGMVHQTESGTPRGSDLKKHFQVGQEVEAKIMRIEEDGKIRLSIAALARDDERRDFEKFREGGAAEATAGGEAQTSSGGAKKKGGGGKKPEPRNFGTLGDLLAKKVKK